VKTDEARAGQKAARDVTDLRGNLLFKAGTELSAELLETCKKCTISHLFIEDAGGTLRSRPSTSRPRRTPFSGRSTAPSPASMERDHDRAQGSLQALYHGQAEQIDPMAEPNPHQLVQEKVRKLVDRIQGLPTLPVMMTNINQMILNPRTSPKEVAHVISNDPSLTSKVLRVVNSSFYGFPTASPRSPMRSSSSLQHDQVDRALVEIFGRLPPLGEARRLRSNPSLEATRSLRVRPRRRSAPAQLPDARGAVHRGPAARRGQDRDGQYMPEKFAEVISVVHSRDCLISEAEMQVAGGATPCRRGRLASSRSGTCPRG